MALSNGSINNGREITKKIRKDLNSARSSAGNLKVFLSQNANYNLFVTGTNYGNLQNQKIQKILGLLDQNLSAQTTNLIMKLNGFFDYQEELNNKKINGEH